MTDTLTPVLSANWADERSWKITNYERRGGYQALRKALKMTPDEVINEVKDVNRVVYDVSSKPPSTIEWE